MSTGHFHLSRATQSLSHQPPDTPVSNDAPTHSLTTFNALVASSGPTFSVIQPLNLNTQVNSTTASNPPHCRGVVHNADYDKAHGYTLEWASEVEFKVWLTSEMKEKCIEFNLKETTRNKKPVAEHVWITMHTYVCAREGGGGSKKQCTKSDKSANWSRKVPTKRLAEGCSAQLQVKSYPETRTLHGLYNTSHSHDTGQANLLYTNISWEARHKAEAMIHSGMSISEVVSLTTSDHTFQFHSHGIISVAKPYPQKCL